MAAQFAGAALPFWPAASAPPPPPEWMRFECQEFHFFDTHLPSRETAGLRLWYHAQPGHRVAFKSTISREWSRPQGDVHRFELCGFDYICVVFRWHADLQWVAHGFVRGPEDRPNEWRGFCGHRSLQLRGARPLLLQVQPGPPPAPLELQLGATDGSDDIVIVDAEVLDF